MFDDLDLDTYAAVYEHDIDIALAMALRMSPSIREWLAKAVGAPSAELVSLKVSASVTGGREVDVEVRFGAGDQAFVVEIENKIDVRFGTGQREAYAARACQTRASGGRGACVLFSPKAYADRIRMVDRTLEHHLSYEDFAAQLQQEGPWGRELALLVEHAIRKHRRRGPKGPIDVELTKALREIAESARSIGLTPPTVEPRNANTWITLSKQGFAQVGVDSYISIDPKEGVVDIELFGGRATFALATLAEAMSVEPCELRDGKPSDKNLRIKRRGGATPKIDIRVPIAEQATLVTEIWNEVSFLRNWWEERGAEIMKVHRKA